ncbi:MAG: GNAT family N-acetyltransferase [Rhodospirillales bacterium]
MAAADRRMKLRPPCAQERDILTAICMRSKAYWGYDDLFMARSVPVLTVTGEMIASGLVLVLADHQNHPAGVAALETTDRPDWLELALFFIDPVCIGQGGGRILFDGITRLARRRDAAMLKILADPNAVPFYERMGCETRGDVPSEVIPDRRLPLCLFNLAQAGGAEL